MTKKKLKKVEGPLDINQCETDSEWEEKYHKLKEKYDTFKAETDEYWTSLESWLYHSAPAKDKKGHSEHVNFKLQPEQLDVINSIRKFFPDTFFKSASDLYRALLMGGCKSALKGFKKFFPNRKNKSVEKMLELIDMMEVIEMDHRGAEVKQKYLNVRHKAVDINLNGQVIDILDKKYQKFVAEHEKNLEQK